MCYNEWRCPTDSRGIAEVWASLTLSVMCSDTQMAADTTQINSVL